LVEVDDDLGVTSSAEGVPHRFQLSPERTVVVYLAVLHHPDRVVLICDRLSAPGNVDDAETAHADRNGPLHVLAALVGSSVDHCVAHGPEPRGDGRTSRI